MLIFDCETLGQNTQTCPVIDFSYFVFDYDRFTSDDPYTFRELTSENGIQKSKISVENQVKVYGYKIEKSTVEWWKKQGSEARKHINPNPDDVSLSQFFDDIMSYVEKKGPIKYFWSRSNTFDPIILHRIAVDLGEEDRYNKNLQHWKVRDTRTYIDSRTNFDPSLTSFIPIEDEEKWKKVFQQHNSIHDVAADILRMQVLARLAAGKEI